MFDPQTAQRIYMNFSIGCLHAGLLDEFNYDSYWSNIASTLLERSSERTWSFLKGGIVTWRKLYTSLGSKALFCNIFWCGEYLMKYNEKWFLILCSSL
jgi:hypothetical protein